MSFHIITVLQPGARLSVDRGFLVCKYPDQSENRIALADVRVLIIGVPSIAFTNTCLARLMANDSLVLHCDEHYKPIGWTASLDRVTRREVFANQIAAGESFNRSLWKAVVKQKMLNQAAVLEALSVEHDLLRLINKPLPNEANVSRQYWGPYFETLGNKQKRERRGAETFENKALNYGYAVLSTLVHRVILIHGLLPSLGIHHDFRYRSHPLVYDLMEPFRPFIDLFLALWIAEQKSTVDDECFPHWIRTLMESFRTCRLKHPEEKHSHKFMDAIDLHVRSVATCLETRYFKVQDFSKLWLPQLEHHYWHQANTNNEEEEEFPDDRLAISQS